MEPDNPRPLPHWKGAKHGFKVEVMLVLTQGIFGLHSFQSKKDVFEVRESRSKIPN